ncbi:MAG: hypothetical protein U0793_26195 [Gemmataceae bacterium]
MQTPVDQVRDLLESEWKINWPAPLVKSLRERSDSVALDWAFRCIRRLLDLSETPHRNQIKADLEMLESWRLTLPESESLQRKSEEIWYRPNRDDAQTALAHFCWDLARSLFPTSEEDVRWLYPTISLLTGSDRPIASLVGLCIEEYEASITTGA